MSIKQPLLAATLKDLENIKFPVYATPKIDGIRALKIDDVIVSRSFKPIRNKQLAEFLKNLLPNGSDGEIFSGKTFQDSTSTVMTSDANIENTIFYWFDYVKNDVSDTYLKRMQDMKEYIEERPEILENDKVKIVPLFPKKIDTFEELTAFETHCLAQNFEGVMIRRENGAYKNGRSTEKQGILLKMKKFDDDEAVVTGYSPLQKNLNDKTSDAFGYSCRSSCQDGKVDLEMLGSLHVEWNGIKFSIGSGFDHDLRKTLWNDRETLIGKIVKFKYFSVGMKTAPRFPTFLGFRHTYDMSFDPENDK